MANFQIVEPTAAKSSNRANLPTLGEYGQCKSQESIPVNFGTESEPNIKDVKVGTVLDFGNGERYVLRAPVGYRWDSVRGRQSEK